MASTNFSTIMGGKVIADYYTNNWAWQCPHCADCINFLDTMHPDNDKSGTAFQIINNHESHCQHMMLKFQNNTTASQMQQQIIYNNLMAQQQAMMSTVGVPGLTSNYGGLGGLGNGNRQTNTQAPGSAIALTGNTVLGAINSIAGTFGGTIAYEEPEPIKRAGVKFGEFIGWRMWGLKDGYLWSYSADVLWAPGEPMKGKPGDHDHVGIWAFKDKRFAIKKMLTDHYHTNRDAVFGSIRMYGEVVEHEEGYRSEYATIATIDDMKVIDPYDSNKKLKCKKTILEQLRKTYKLDPQQ